MASEDPRPRVGVSTCLLGEAVRWDGNHKRDAFLMDVLAEHVQLVPVCPEVEIGLGTPREPIRLERDGDGARLVATNSRKDWTAKMDRYADRRVRQLKRMGLSGYVLKKDSPSCGMERVRVWPEAKGPARRDGRGRFAEALLRDWPGLPVEEEGRLKDMPLRERWIGRVFAAKRVQDFFAGRWTMGGLVAFHTREKLLLMAHSPKAYRELGQLVAGGKSLPPAELRDRYVLAHETALARPATRGRHMNVLEHGVGYFRKIADEATRKDLRERLEDYRAGRIPRWVPIMLVRHTALRLGIDYLAEQIYFDPHPSELTLRPWL